MADTDRELVQAFLAAAYSDKNRYANGRKALDAAAVDMGWTEPSEAYAARKIRAGWICSRGTSRRPIAHLRDAERNLLQHAVGFLAAQGLVAGANSLETPKKPPPAFIELPIEAKKPLRSQAGAEVQALTGHYLILRRIYSVPGLLVSYMRVTPGATRRKPLKFRTTGNTTHPQIRQEPPTVIGNIFEPVEVNGARLETADIYAVGTTLETNELRSAILRRRRRGNTEPPLYDLHGVRLGLGAVDGAPRGYFIWASRMPWDDLGDEDIAPLTDQLVRFFPFASQDPTSEELRELKQTVPNIEDVVSLILKRTSCSMAA